jgi:hypothetical protein
MSEFFIVLSRKPEEFETLPDAIAQQLMLKTYAPGQEHIIFRCKRWLHGAKHFSKAVDLLGSINRDGLTDENRSRLIVLLGTITTRTPTLKTLTRVEGPDEFRAGQKQ